MLCRAVAQGSLAQHDPSFGSCHTNLAKSMRSRAGMTKHGFFVLGRAMAWLPGGTAQFTHLVRTQVPLAIYRASFIILCILGQHLYSKYLEVTYGRKIQQYSQGSCSHVMLFHYIRKIKAK